MANIRKLKIDQVLYDKHKYKMGRTNMSTWGVWTVVVKEIDPEFRWILASWNGNAPSKMYGRQIERLLVNEPKIKQP